MNSITVTGGAGFIGSHLVESLVNEGHRVRVFDNLDTGNRANLAPLESRIEFIQGDVRDAAAVEKAVAGADFVFHLAAMVSVPKSVREPRNCHDICATGTLNVLEASKNAGVKRVVYAGSSSAYGDTNVSPIPETTPLHALSPYAAGKLAGEHYCTAYANVSKLETTRCRFFNVYGPRQDPSSPYSGVISIFCSKLLAGERPTIFGDGNQTRDFVFVKDVVKALIAAATTQGVNGKVFNVGTGRAVRVAELARLIAKIVGVNLEPKLAEARTGDIIHSVADLTEIRKHLKFEASHSLESGLPSCVDFYRSTLVE
jgi:UDP-glucose 4-epimerase